jgi:excisionase family DNA binding protein
MTTDRLDRALLELAAALREELAEAASGTPERLLDIPSAAAALGIGRTRLYAELDSGQLRSVKVGRRRLVPSSAIAERAKAATP